MKRTLFTILWIVDAFIIGMVLFGLSAYTVLRFMPSKYDPTSPAYDYQTLSLVIAVILFPIGLPTLALILGVFGKLPGTQSMNQSVL